MSNTKTPEEMFDATNPLQHRHDVARQYCLKIIREYSTQQNRAYVEALKRVIELFTPSIDFPKEQDQEDLLNEINSLIRNEGK